MNDQVTLQPCERLNHAVLHSLRDYEEVAGNSETLQAVESSVMVWLKHIRQVPVHIPSREDDKIITAPEIDLSVYVVICTTLL